MAVGNTFGATALSSYGGFWIAYAILLTPGFSALSPYTEAADEASALGFFLTGWFIFTFILLVLTLKSTVMFFLLFFTLDLAFLMLACGEFAAANGNAAASLTLKHAGGGFGLLAAFLAWYNAFAGMADKRYVMRQFMYISGISVLTLSFIATRSSSSPSSTSPGQTRVVRRAARPLVSKSKDICSSYERGVKEKIMLGKSRLQQDDAWRRQLIFYFSDGLLSIPSGKCAMRMNNEQ